MRATDIVRLQGRHVFVFCEDRSFPGWLRGVEDGKAWVSETDRDDFRMQDMTAVDLEDVLAVAVADDAVSADVYDWLSGLAKPARGSRKKVG